MYLSFISTAFAKVYFGKCIPIETWLGGGSQMHKQEESLQIPNTIGERDQNTQGKSNSCLCWLYNDSVVFVNMSSEQ